MEETKDAVIIKAQKTKKAAQIMQNVPTQTKNKVGAIFVLCSLFFGLSFLSFGWKMIQLFFISSSLFFSYLFFFDFLAGFEGGPAPADRKEGGDPGGESIGLGGFLILPILLLPSHHHHLLLFPSLWHFLSLHPPQKAKAAVSEGSLSSALFKRLDLFGADGEKFTSLHSGIDDVINLDDPTGKVTMATKMDEGLELYRVTCPVGVLCIIFEARPEVMPFFVWLVFPRPPLLNAHEAHR